MTDNSKLKEVARLIADQILNCGIEGLSERNARGFTIEADRIEVIPGYVNSLTATFNQGNAVSATIDVVFDFVDSKDQFSLRTEVTWPSAAYTIENAQKASKLHSQIVELASSIEEKFGEKT